MRKPENPSAFPRDGYQEGMTLRDYFAGQALVGMIADYNITDSAKYSYEAADEMLKARSKS